MTDDFMQKRKQEQLHIKESSANGSPLLILSGRFNATSKRVLLESLKKKLEKPNWQRLLIDLEQVTFMDSSGLGVLALTYKKVKEMKKELVLVNPRSQVREFFDQTNLSVFIPVVESNLDYSTFKNIQPLS